MESALAALEVARNELLLFAGVGLLIGGFDELLLDLFYVGRRLWRDLFVYTRHARMTAVELPPPGTAGPIAIFVPAWDESAVIGAMLSRCLALWADERMVIFVGAYPNDPRTIEVVSRLMTGANATRLRLVIHSSAGPTTKADCLNQLWQALVDWEGETGERALCVVLHDAEDVVHADELRLVGALSPRFALVQLPVLPLVSTGSRWVSGHYCDEFAEAHGKSLLVREAIGAAVPSAGVGCAFNRDAMQHIADARDGRPFDPASLTEDYELGLRVGELGGRGILVRMRDAKGELIATKEYFPDTVSSAVRQKARWMIGISLAGWDRLGWTGRLSESWMRLRDRRAALSALVLLAAYAGLLLSVLLMGLQWAFVIPTSDWSPTLGLVLTVNAVMLVWRLAVRLIFVWRVYGLAEGLRSVPRTVVANMIAMLAARRALTLYLAHLRGRPLSWDKTIHRFPDEMGSDRS